MFSRSFLSLSVLLISVARLINTSPVITLDQRASTGYAPTSIACPTTPLIRTADGISSDESAYRDARHTKASAALKTWLTKTNSAFNTSGKMPTLAMTTSGGGLRALLIGAGVIQGLDIRDSNVGTSGLYQAMTYQAALSGGAWLLSSFAGNNYPTISSLRDSLWETAFELSIFDPLNVPAAVVDYSKKDKAGFPVSLIDLWGRLLSFALLKGTDGGVSDTLSGLTSLSNFTAHNVPYPIITSRGVQPDECQPPQNGPQWEFHPYEFGSWDAGVAAFTNTSILGSSLSNGKPTGKSCTGHYDNLGFVLGTSSALFNTIGLCTSTLPSNGSDPAVNDILAALATLEETIDIDAINAIYPNPFYKSASSPLVSNEKDLSLVDGGEALQNDPIWPLIQPSRPVDVILVSENSADTTTNYPNGSEIYTTYIQSLSAGLSRMPTIPPVDTFISKGLNQRATFFGCNNASTATIVFVPNYNFTFDSGQPTLRIQYDSDDTDSMIKNGQAVITQDGDKQWPTCLGCAIMKKAATTDADLPDDCEACFRKYCFN